MSARDSFVELGYKAGLRDAVVHAHWIEGEDINCKPIVECSHCGDVWHLDGDSDPFHDHFYYCPNCGAKMDER